MRQLFVVSSRSRRPSGRLRRRGAALLLSVSACGCATVDRPNPVPPAYLNFNHIELRRHGCVSGDCPTYSIVIQGDGSVHYHGGSHVAVLGDRDGQANAQALQQLRELLFDDPDVFWLKDRYSPGHNRCGAWTMDGSAVTLDIDAPHLHKHINHYLGCHGAPPLLTRIETAIDRAADDQRWISAPRSSDALTQP